MLTSFLQDSNSAMNYRDKLAVCYLAFVFVSVWLTAMGRLLLERFYDRDYALNILLNRPSISLIYNSTFDKKLGAAYYSEVSSLIPCGLIPCESVSTARAVSVHCWHCHGLFDALLTILCDINRYHGILLQHRYSSFVPHVFAAIVWWNMSLFQLVPALRKR